MDTHNEWLTGVKTIGAGDIDFKYNTLRHQLHLVITHLASCMKHAINKMETGNCL